jgi:Uma2 family endonuclease
VPPEPLLDSHISLRYFPDMSAILDLPEVRERVSRLSVSEYHRLGEFNENGKRTELIRGIVIEKMSKSPLHSSIVGELHRLILAAAPEGYVVRKEEPLTLRDSEPEPDVAVVKGSAADFRRAHPATAELVVEVAVSSASLDRENAALFAEAGVREYWIVLGREQRVEVYRRPEGGEYRDRTSVAVGETLSCASVAGISIPVGRLFE